MHKPNHLMFTDQDQWRLWLEENCSTKQEVWLVLYKKKYRNQGLALDEAVEQALCFGWIDSTLNRIDEKCFALRFSPRNRNSVWSVSNINRAEKLIADGKMTHAGLSKISEAKETGEWDAAIQREHVENIPEMLMRALNEKEGALAAYQALTDSRKKQYLYWLQNAKRDETRMRRVQRIVNEVLGNFNVKEIQ